MFPLVLVVRAAPTAREGAMRAWRGLAGYVLTTQYWLLPSTGPLLVLLAAGLGALWVPWGWAAHRLLSAPVTLRGTLAAVAVLPSAWVLAEVVRSFLGHDPLSGSMFVFRNRSAQRVKVLWWDRDGLAIYYKRLERGTFRFPAGDDKAMAIDSGQLLRLLSGMTVVATRAG